MNTGEFAREWCDAWNAHDLERVLQHFHDDVVFTSPGAQRFMPESGGVVRGKAALRAYWSKALAAIPDLHFRVESVFAGVDALVIQYLNQKGVRVSEVLIFNGDLVRYGYGTYPIGVDNPTGASLVTPRSS